MLPTRLPNMASVGVQWTDESVKCLLDYMVKTNILTQLESCKRNGVFYRKIVQHLHNHGHDKTQVQVSVKIKNLKREYAEAKKAGEARTNNGMGKTIDRFMNEMEQLMCARLNGVHGQLDSEPECGQIVVVKSEPNYHSSENSATVPDAFAPDGDLTDRDEATTRSPAQGWLLDSNEGQFIVSEVQPPFDKDDHPEHMSERDASHPFENPSSSKRRRTEDVSAVAQLIDDQKDFFRELHDRECRHMAELLEQQRAAEERLNKEQRDHEKLMIASLIKAQEKQSERLLKSQREHQAAIVNQMQASQQQHEKLLLKIAAKILHASTAAKPPTG